MAAHETTTGLRSPPAMLALATTGFAINFWAWALLSPLGPLFRTTGPVFSATTRMDKLMYVFLASVIVLGLVNTVMNVTGDYDYREGVSVWFRGIFRFQLHPDLMAEAPLGFQLHGLIAMGLFALWPFTRLVHVFSAPLGYLTRPYIVYRSRDDTELGSHTPRRGWERSGR